jgi:hypothetical protein
MQLVEGVRLREKVHGERADLGTMLKYLVNSPKGSPRPTPTASSTVT